MSAGSSPLTAASSSPEIKPVGSPESSISTLSDQEEEEDEAEAGAPSPARSQESSRTSDTLPLPEGMFDSSSSSLSDDQVDEVMGDSNQVEDQNGERKASHDEVNGNMTEVKGKMEDDRKDEDRETHEQSDHSNSEKSKNKSKKSVKIRSSPSPSLTPPPTEKLPNKALPKIILTTSPSGSKRKRSSVLKSLTPEEDREGDVSDQAESSRSGIERKNGDASVPAENGGVSDMTPEPTNGVEETTIADDLAEIMGTAAQTITDAANEEADVMSESGQQEAQEEEEATAAGLEAEGDGDRSDSPVAPQPMKFTGTHSSHAPPPTQAAIKALFLLEIKFAALRDKLYIERMEEAAEEEEMLLNGTHPALQMLHKTLSQRRERLHEVVSRRHAQAMAELQVVRQAEQDAVWSWWTDERDRMHWEEFEQTWSKRRRLAREKNEIEQPAKAPPVPRLGDPRFGKTLDWAAGPSPSRLTIDEGSYDLALMERRHVQVSRHASPGVFPPLSAYTIPQQMPPQYPQYSSQTYAEVATPQESHQSRYQSSHPPRRSSHHTSHSAWNSHSHSNHNHQVQDPAPHNASSTAYNVFGGANAIDQIGYMPRAGSSSQLGPTSSSSSIGGHLQRREGRTVPTASTIFGSQTTQLSQNSQSSQPISHNLTASLSNPLNNASNHSSPAPPHTSRSQDLKYDNIEGFGPCGSKPMNNGMMTSLSKSHSNSPVAGDTTNKSLTNSGPLGHTAGFVTLGTPVGMIQTPSGTANHPHSQPQSQPATASTHSVKAQFEGGGQNGFSSGNGGTPPQTATSTSSQHTRDRVLDHAAGPNGRDEHAHDVQSQKKHHIVGMFGGYYPRNDRPGALSPSKVGMTQSIFSKHDWSVS